MFAGTWRRRTTRGAGQGLREPRPLHHLRHGIPSSDASLERARRAPRGDHPDVREDGDPRRLPARPVARRAPDRRRVPDRPAVRRGRPARGRPGLVGHRHDRHLARRRPAGGARRGVRPLVRPRRSPSPTSCATAGHAPPPEASPTLPEVAAAFAAIEQASGAGPQVGDPARAARTVRPADRQVHRQGARRRPADRPARGARRGRHRARLRPAARRRQVGRDAGRGRRAAGGARPRRRPRERVAGALPSAQVHARLAGRGRRGDRRPARARRSGSRTSTTASGPSSTSAAARSASTRATCTTSARATPRSSSAAEPLPWDGILDGEILGWRDGMVLPFIALQARLGRKTPSAAIQAEVPVIFVTFDALAVGPGGDDAGRAAPAPAADRAPRAARRARAAAGRRRAAASRART